MPNPVKLEAEVSEIVDYGDGIYSVKFQLLSGLARFKPGQFLHLALDPYDPSEGYWPESRVFSMASMPGGKQTEILYSVRGKYTERMSRELAAGKKVWLKFPYGDFIIENRLAGAKKAVLIAGGTGISPFLPFLRNLPENGGASVSLYYGIRGKEFYICGDFIESLKGKVEVSVIPGVMDVEAISREIAVETGIKCFVSGPPAMIKAYQEKLAAAGLPSEHIIIDAWE